MSAKNAVLEQTGSHHISGERSNGAADGISKEEVFGYFSAQWRGRSVIVTMSADRYAASFWDAKTDKSTNRLTEWRIYASEARFHDPEKNGGRGESVSGTARSALSKLCEPLMVEWLSSEAYATSFQRALATMIMRKFRDDYSASLHVSTALAVFRDRLSPDLYHAISETLKAYETYEAVKAITHKLIDEVV